MSIQPSPDPCPRSAVSHGVGLAGLAGLVAWALVARFYGMDGPYAGMAGVFACGLPMVLWSIFVDKVHRRPSTGIDWHKARPLRETIDISLVKLTGLWATWAIIGIGYCLCRWYWDGAYGFSMQMLGAAAPWLFGLSIPYVLWLDRHMVEPRDGAYAFGQRLIGSAAGVADGEAIANHWRSWLVKGFFLAFMLSIVPGNFADMVHWRTDEIFRGPVPLASFLIAVMFVIDVAFATIGYMLTCKPLDAHIRTANPYMQGWTAALICYPPFVLMGNGGPLDYHLGTRDWAYWFDGFPALLWLFAGALVLLTGLYAWATVAFGIRFSNLTHRGVLTHGPYRLTRHPAYVAKNIFWWLSTLPFLVTTDSLTDAARNTATMALVSGVYYWRARTEEKHLMSDPDYRAYHGWMERHGPVPRLIAWVRGRPVRQADLQPAE